MTRTSLRDYFQSRLLPRDSFTIRTNLRPHEVIQRVDGIVQPYRISMLADFDRSRPYYGQVSRSVFAVRRLTPYSRAAALPWIDGKVRAEGDQTVVELVIEHEVITRYTFLFFYGAFGLMLLYQLGVTVVKSISQPATTGSLLLGLGIVALLLILPAGFVRLMFNIEAARSKRFFRKLLEDIDQ